MLILWDRMPQYSKLHSKSHHPLINHLLPNKLSRSPYFVMPYISFQRCFFFSVPFPFISSNLVWSNGSSILASGLAFLELFRANLILHANSWKREKLDPSKGRGITLRVSTISLPSLHHNECCTLCSVSWLVLQSPCQITSTGYVWESLHLSCTLSRGSF